MRTFTASMVTAVGGPSSGQIQGSRAHIFIYNIVHSAEDYGTITTYLRMQGVMPPSSALDTRPGRQPGPLVQSLETAGQERL